MNDDWDFIKHMIEGFANLIGYSVLILGSLGAVLLVLSGLIEAVGCK